MNDSLNLPANNQQPDLTEILPVNFTREELIVLNNILDLATKYEGLKIAETTLFLSRKIKDFLSNKPV
jgi:hypothetical protein